MEPPPQNLLPRTEQDKHLNLRHNERWEALKPVIVELYTGQYGNNGKSTTMTEVVAFMKTHYSFHAAYDLSVPFRKHYSLPRVRLNRLTLFI